MIMKYRRLLDSFIKLHGASCSCEKVFCTTCGGVAGAVERNMTTKLRSNIHAALLEMTVSDYRRLGEWGELLQKVDLISVRAIFEREKIKNGQVDIRKLDQYIFGARGFMRNDDAYNIFLEQAIKVAIETSDDSLIETVSIVLGEDILNNNDLFSLALEKSKVNKNIGRVLYNTLREVSPKVRGYVGGSLTSS